MASDGRSLWDSIHARGAPQGRLSGRACSVALRALAGSTSLGDPLEELRGRSVLLAIKDQLTAALALLELDGVARRLVLCPPDLVLAHVPQIIRDAQIDAAVRDNQGATGAELGISHTVSADTALRPFEGERRRTHATEWILLTSGTTGAPKLVLHTLASLTSALQAESRVPEARIWCTFYDIRRYGGLQIFLRALHDGSLVLSDPAEEVGEFLARAGSAGVTHISGTPSHWRKALMSGVTSRIAPRYVRLSGEIADQAVLDALRAAYPSATVAHAFASTEAGVAFEVRDGRAGFPRELLGAAGGRVRLRVPEETLQISSSGTAQRYLGEGAEPLRGADGFVDTGDRVQESDGRYYFLGRRGGVINVGGLKVHPEEVEAVINTHPWVRMSLVKARRSPITGAVVTADVVLRDEAAGRPAAAVVMRELTERCKQALASHKVPALIRFVPALEVSPSGKLVRPVA